MPRADDPRRGGDLLILHDRTTGEEIDLLAGRTVLPVTGSTLAWASNDRI